MDTEDEDTKSHSQLEPLPKKSKSKKNKKKHQETPSQQVTVKVQVVPEHPNKTSPIIGYFPSGFDPSANRSGATSFQVYRHSSLTKRLELVVSPAGAPVQFVGTSYSGEAATGHRAKYALGVFDKEAKTLKVVPIAANKIFRLEPKVKGLEAAAVEPASSTLEELTKEERALRQRQTTAALGTKKQNEKNRKMLALRQDADPESQKNLDVKLKDIDVNKNALESTEVHVSRNLPPYDTSATTPQEAYILDKIILPGEWDALEDIYNMLQFGEEADFSAYPSFICNRIGKLKKIKDESEKKKKSCIFSYLTHLIKFRDLYTPGGASSARRHKIPPILSHKFSTMFADSESKWLPRDKENLLLYHIMVLTLFCDEFRTDYADITNDLRLSTLLVRQLYQYVGCKSVSQNSHATLQVPLKFYDTKQGKKRKR